MSDAYDVTTIRSHQVKVGHTLDHHGYAVEVLDVHRLTPAEVEAAGKSRFMIWTRITVTNPMRSTQYSSDTAELLLPDDQTVEVLTR